MNELRQEDLVYGSLIILEDFVFLDVTDNFLKVLDTLLQEVGESSCEQTHLPSLKLSQTHVFGEL